ncbi:MAG: redoxin family protein [Opitutaceae bacterium]
MRATVLRLLPAFVIVVGLSAAEPREQLRTLAERFDRLDRDGDGKLSAAETGNAAWFSRLDRDGDGYITREELQTLISWLGSGQGAPASASARTDAAKAVVAELPPPLESPREGPRVLKPGDVGVGRRVADVAFTDLEQRAGRLSDFAGSKALVIAFTGTGCPLARKYTPTLVKLEREFGPRGVAFLLVNAAAADPVADIRAMRAEHGLRGRYVHDVEGAFARALGAKTSTEMFVLDAARTVVFRGAVDDQHGLGYSLEAPRRRFLADALEAFLAGGTPLIAATDAPGCALEVERSNAGVVASGSLTYHGRISRIVLANCVECHRPGGVGPFSLLTYDDVVSRAGMIRRQVSRGAMPPWFAAPGKAGEPAHWRNDRSLSVEDKADLLAWLEGDRLLGDPADAPRPRVFAEGWLIGNPDAVIELPRAVAVKADGVMPYQTLRVETTFTEDKWVKAYELQPTAREVVHHIIVRVHAKGARLARGEGESERDGLFAAYVPGNSHAIFPPGFAKKIPAGATVTFQMHYTPNGKATTDRTRLGLVFASEPPRHVIEVAGVANPRLRIPPGAGNHAETAAITLPFDATILGFMPHMHLRGKAARYETVLPDGSRRLLLDVPRYDFNWQLPYEFAEPPTLPRGSRLIYTAWYDNSAVNPANPDPSREVRWGPQTYDEMMLGYVEYYVPSKRPETKAAAGQ